MSSFALKVDNVSKSFRLPHERHSSLKQTALNWHKRKYENLQVLKNIDFEVKPGEFFGIVGRNGSGKSTLLKLIAGIYQPTKGQIQLNGKLTPFIELGVGFNPELTGRDNIFLNGAILGLTKKQIEKKYDSIVGFSELEKFMDQKLKNYSSGMLVRLAFSIAIQAHADILLVDEVLAVGDANFQRKCFDIFDQIKKEGKTVIFVTHDMSSVQRFCDRALVIESGKILKIGDPVKVADTYQELNIRGMSKEEEKENQRNKTRINIRIIEEDKKAKKLKLRITYKNPDKVNVYVGFTLIRDGLSVAELNSSSWPSSKPSGVLEYGLDTSILNPGYYELAVGLINADNKFLLKSTHKKAQFNILGYDAKRGGAISLPNNWITK